MKTLADRLKYARQQCKLSQTELAKKSDVSQGLIGQLERGENEGTKHIAKIANALGVDAFWLTDGIGVGEPRPTGATISIKTDGMPDHIHAIPLLNAHGSMGGGAYPDATEYTIAEIDVTETWLRQTLPTISAPANLRLMTGLGDSMTPTYRNGDTLFVDTGVKTIDIDGVFVFEFKDVVYVKRVQRVPDGLKIISDNKQYDPFTIEREKYPEIMVYGRVHGALEYKGF